MTSKDFIHDRSVSNERAEAGGMERAAAFNLLEIFDDIMRMVE